jgi:hypothetical protein
MMTNLQVPFLQLKHIKEEELLLREIWMLLELLKMIKTEKVVQIQGNQGRQEKTLKSSQEVRYFTNANLDTVF